MPAVADLSPAPGYRAIVHSLAPVLIVRATPMARSRFRILGTSTGIPERRRERAAGLGHTQWSECIAARYERFVRTTIARGLDLRRAMQCRGRRSKSVSSAAARTQMFTSSITTANAIAKYRYPFGISK